MPDFQLSSGRLRKYIPEPQRYAARYGGFTLTHRDHEILDLVYRYRHLEARHIRALIPGSDQQITRRLQGLFHNRYLRRYVQRARMRVDLEPGTPLTAYGLDARGAQALSAFPGRRATEPVRWKNAYTRRTEWFLAHRLAVSHVRCVLELAALQVPGIEMLEWIDGEAVSLAVNFTGSRSRIRRIVPDAQFAIRESGQRRDFFLEVDRSTEEHRRLTDKFEGYWRHINDNAQRGGGSHRVNVLFVTTSEARIRNTIRTLREMEKPNRAGHGGRGLFLLAVMESFDLLRPVACLGPVWQKASQPTVPQPLVLASDSG